MKSSIILVSAGVVVANTYPDCEHDNCYNNLIDKSLEVTASVSCFEFLAGTTTAASAIPAQFGNRQYALDRVSSACSYIIYTATQTTAPEITTNPCYETTAASTTTVPVPNITTVSDATAIPDTVIGTSTVDIATVLGTPTVPSVTTIILDFTTISSVATVPDKVVLSTTIFPNLTPPTIVPIITASDTAAITTSSATIWTTKMCTITRCPPDTHCPSGDHTTIVTEITPITTASLPETGRTQWTTKMYNVSSCLLAMTNCTVSHFITPGWTSITGGNRPHPSCGNTTCENHPPTVSNLSFPGAAGHLVSNLEIVAVAVGIVAVLL